MSDIVGRYLRSHLTEDDIRILREEKIKSISKNLTHIDNMTTISNLMFLLNKLLGKDVRLKQSKISKTF